MTHLDIESHIKLLVGIRNAFSKERGNSIVKAYENMTLAISNLQDASVQAYRLHLDSNSHKP